MLTREHKHVLQSVLGNWTRKTLEYHLHEDLGTHLYRGVRHRGLHSVVNALTVRWLKDVV